jgi:hypothetical protein
MACALPISASDCTFAKTSCGVSGAGGEAANEAAAQKTIKAAMPAAIAIPAQSGQKRVFVCEIR